MGGNNAAAGTNCTGIAAPKSFGGFKWGSFVDTGRLGDSESTNGEAEIDRVRSRSESDTDSRKAKPVVGNDVATGGDILDICPENILGSSTRGAFVASGSKLCNPKLAGGAESDGVRSRSETDFRGDAKAVAGNNAEIRFNTRRIYTLLGNDSTLADGLIQAVLSFDMAPSKIDPPGWAEPRVKAP